MPSDWNRNSDYMDDDDYRRIRDAEKEEYAYFNEEADDENEDSAEAVDPSPSGVTNDPRTDFIVVLPHQFIRIPQDSNLAWMTMFYALPKELVSKRPEYLELPRHIVKLINSEKHMNLIKQDAFL